ncbi:MAG: hypothetical protein HC914_15025 [Chloroflexaceae bacterium]|nr:hypothetical protein [Chloroflexaceae bacterium]
MIDLHMHILPHLDDGARDLEEAVEMARMLVADGVTTVAATPHDPASDMVYGYSIDKVLHRLDYLRRALKALDIPLQVLTGTELYADFELLYRLSAGDVLSYNDSQTVLVEFPTRTPLETIQDTVSDLLREDYRMVLAHPERLKIVQDNANVLLPLIERGIVMQLTAGALTGDQGERMQKRAEELVAHRLVHTLASDAHGIYTRPPGLAKARTRVAELIGETAAREMVYDVPMALLHDEYIALPEPQPVARSLLARIFQA